MPSFKTKTTKKIEVDKKSTVTLDSKHSELLKTFKDKYEIELPQLQLEKQRLKMALKNPSALPIDTKLELQDQLKAVSDQIKTIKKEYQDYLLNNSAFIFDYFEHKKKIADCSNKTTILANFFKCAEDDGSERSDSTDKHKSKLKLENPVHNYLCNVDDAFIDINDFVISQDQCHTCHKGEMIAVEHDGVMVCNHCAKSIPYLVDNEKPSYKEPPKEVCFYAYQRINHFREIMAQFQAKETTQIPEEVMENIKRQIKKERIELSELTNERAKEILKKLDYNKYYEHIPFIKHKFGIQPPIMSPELEETLCNLFMDTQAPYAKFCPDWRNNFLNYYYTMYKLCELLGQTQFLQYFPLLKDPEKRLEQDEIWRKICEELDWDFIPTI